MTAREKQKLQQHCDALLRLHQEYRAMAKHYRDTKRPQRADYYDRRAVDTWQQAERTLARIVA